MPHLARASGGHDRRVVVGVPVAVTDDPDRAREQIAAEYDALARLPSYAATLERDGFTSPGEIAVTGDEATVAAGLRRYADAGATDLNVSLAGSAAERARTLAFLGELRGRRHS